MVSRQPCAVLQTTKHGISSFADAPRRPSPENSKRPNSAEYASANRSLRENRVYQRFATGGSGAVRRSRVYLQQAGASARARLIAAAAQEWGVAASACKAENGTVVHAASGRRVNYGAIAADAAKVQLDAEPAIKTPEQFKLLGQSQKRLDVPLKVDGSAIYGIDVRLPNMLYAAVMTCPVFGGTLKSYNFEAIKNMPGVHSAVEVSNGIAVVADSFWRATRRCMRSTR